jgi:hypothetical protein
VANKFVVANSSLFESSDLFRALAAVNFLPALPDIFPLTGSPGNPFGSLKPGFGAGGPFASQPILVNGEGEALSAPSLGGAGGKHGGSTGGSTTTTTAPPTGSSSGLTIKLNFDTSFSSAPTALTAAITSAAQYLGGLFSDPITVTINVGYGEVGGYAMGGNALGSSMSYLNSYSYTQIAAAMAADATSATDSSAVASLPSGNPTGGTMWLTTANAKAVGLLANNTSVDGYVGFSSTLPFDFDLADGVTAGAYDFFGTAMHELTEVLGRMTFDGGTIAGVTNSYYGLDLFHYSAPGVRSFSGSQAGYFSVDGGVTNLGAFNTVGGGDPGDWGSSMGNDAFNAFSNSGVVNAVSSSDLAVMDAIGWNLAGASVPAAPTIPPTLTIGLALDSGISATDLITSNATLSGTTSAGAVVTLLAGTSVLGTSTADGSGLWRFAPVSLAQGSQSITAKAVISGASVSAALTFTYDTIAPVVTIGLISDTGASGTDNVTSNPALTGNTDAGAAVTLFDGSSKLGTAIANSAGVWSFTPTGLTAGTHTITADATDAAGNSAGGSLSFTYNPPASTGVAFDAVPSFLAKATTATGLAARGSLVSLSQVGGPAGDSYSYTLGGAAASAFSITSQGNVGTILAGPAGVSGAANGKLYSLSASAVDTTTGVTGAASQLAVVIGAGAGDTIAVGAMLGTSPAPAFIFGLAGNDTINASGVASKLWIDGGAGADTMTGGTGGTTYLYGGAAESVASAMDVITNFDVTRDLIDLRALGGTLNVAGQVGTSGKLGGNTIAWQQSGDNTFVYVNAGHKPEAFGSADMKIELLGSVSLSAGSFLHI